MQAGVKNKIMHMDVTKTRPLMQLRDTYDIVFEYVREHKKDVSEMNPYPVIEQQLHNVGVTVERSLLSYKPNKIVYFPILNAMKRL